MKPRIGMPTAMVRSLFSVFYLVPLAWIILTSFKSSTDVFSPKRALFFTPTLAAYKDTLSPELATALLQSATIAFFSTTLVLVVAVPAAYALARKTGLWPTVILGVFIVLQMIPQTAQVIPLYQVFGRAGILDTVFAVVLADAALMAPFAVILMRPFFRSVPEALEEAALVDGANSFRVFWSIVIPVVRNGVATTATVVFLIVWGEFLYAINFFTTPGNYPLSALLAQQVSSYGVNWPGLMALGVITSLPILVLFTFTYRLLREGLTVGAVK